MRVGRAFDRLVDGDDDLGADLEVDHAAALHLAGADLGARQVLEDRDGLAERHRDLTDGLQHREVVLVAAVREIEPDDVHAGLDQRLEHAAVP